MNSTYQCSSGEIHRQGEECNCEWMNTIIYELESNDHEEVH